MDRIAREREFLEAYDAYAEPIFRYCFVRVRDRERALDLMHETFAKTWDHLAKGKPVDAMKPFLYAVARNASLNDLARKRAQSLDALRETVGYDPADDAVRSPEDAAEDARLHASLERLRATDREILTLRYFGGLSVLEIARTLGLRPNTVSVRLRRALDNLRALMHIDTV